MPKRVVSFADDIASGSGTSKRIALSNDDGDEFDLPEGDERQTERQAAIIEEFLTFAGNVVIRSQETQINLGGWKSAHER
ncbi:hypothetical protein Aduo_008476 [Ancylostoma duodenale]